MGEKTIYYIIGIGVIGIGIGRYENYYIGILSVSADIEKSLSVVHCPFLGLPEQDNLVKDLKNKLKQETQENAKLNNEMTKKDTIINQLKEKLQIADCQR